MVAAHHRSKEAEGLSKNKVQRACCCDSDGGGRMDALAWRGGVKAVSALCGNVCARACVWVQNVQRSCAVSPIVE